MTSPPIQYVEKVLEDFFKEFNDKTISDNIFVWRKLKNKFLDLINKNCNFDISPKSFELINKLKVMKDYESQLGNEVVNSLFPAMKFKVQMSDTVKNSSIVQIKAPSYPIPKTGRPLLKTQSIETPEIIFRHRESRSLHVPKTSRTLEVENEIKGPLKLFPPYNPPQVRLISQRVPNLKLEHKYAGQLTSRKEPWTANFKLENETDALTYVAAVDPENDFIQFHFGRSEDQNDPYSFKIQQNVKEDSGYETMTKRGILSSRNNGKSEFSYIDEFVVNKTQFHMLRPIRFFSQFKINKYFNYWKVQATRKVFSKRLSQFSDLSWISKGSFPHIYHFFRSAVFSINNLDIFPIRISNQAEFDDISRELYNARETFAQAVGDISKSIRTRFIDFAASVNKNYRNLTSSESTNYLEMPKIPSDLLCAHRVPGKKGLSLTEAKRQIKEHEEIVRKALLEVQTLKSFFMMCDKTLGNYFLNLINSRFNVFVRAFCDTEHLLQLRVVLDYDPERKDLIFIPSCEQVTDMLHRHLNEIFVYLNSFVRPCCIDPLGSGKSLPLSEDSKTFRELVSTHETFLEDEQNLEKIISKSFDEANSSYQIYKGPTLEIFKFQEGWDELKKNIRDPTVYINNLNVLKKLQDVIGSLKGTYIHQLIQLDAKKLKGKLTEFLVNALAENNDILFKCFETICDDMCRDIYEFIKRLDIPDDDLEKRAEFNLAINEAIAWKATLQSGTDVVESIFKCALECAGMMAPVLSKYLKNVRDGSENFISALEKAKEDMEESRERVIVELMRRQKELEDMVGEISTQFKNMFPNLEVDIPSSTAIKEVELAISKVSHIETQIDRFIFTAKRLSYTDYTFDIVNKIRSELEQALQDWINYEAFMQDIDEINDTLLMESDFKRIIKFLNSHNEDELRAVGNPLCDKMANHFAILYNYMPLFTVISKIQSDERVWNSIFDICELEFDQMKDTTLKQFLTTDVINKVDRIRDCAMNMQKQADLSQTFDTFIVSIKTLTLHTIESHITKSNIITFPSIYEAIVTCENFQTYLKSLKHSPFFSQIEKQWVYWDIVLTQLIKILSNLINFQTKYVSMCELTSAFFGELHFPNEVSSKKHIDEWYDSFVNQIIGNPLVLLLINNVNSDKSQSESKKKSLDSDIKTSYTDIIKKDFDEKKFELKIPKSDICSDFNKTLYTGIERFFRGELLIELIREATVRCDYVCSTLNPLFDQQRQNFPRFFFCTNEEILKIMLACSNIVFIVDDLIPIFPSLSRFQCSIGDDNNSIMGVISTSGEMFQFRKDFHFQGLQVVDILQKVEKELKGCIRDSILDAVAAHEFSESSKWILRYPIQGIIIAESICFNSYMNAYFKNPQKMPLQKILGRTIELIDAANKCIRNLPHKSVALSSLIALKIRHRDVLLEFKDNDVDTNMLLWKRQVKHIVQRDILQDQVCVQIGETIFPYGYEMISELDIGPLTKSEGDALLALALCITNAETSLVKQMNGNRNIINSFATFSGLPVFTLPGRMLNNLFPAASSVPSIIRIKDIEEIPASIPNFYGLLESKTKIYKCESHFRTLNLDYWRSLIHIDDEKVPTWLMSRLRPIYLESIPSKLFIQKVCEIREGLQFEKDLPIEYVVQAIKRPNYSQLLKSSRDPANDIIRYPFNFDLPEYILTGKIIVFKEPIEYEIPSNLKSGIESLCTIFERLDPFSPHSRAPDFPIIPLHMSLKIYDQSPIFTRICILAALKNNINLAHFNCVSFSDKCIQFQICGFRQLNVKLYYELTHENIDSWISPEFNNGVLTDIACQHSDLEIVRGIITEISRVTATESPHDSEHYPLNVSLNKINIVREILRTNPLIPIQQVPPAVFDGDYEKIDHNIENEFQYQFKFGNPIVIYGPTSSGKRKFAKKLLLANIKSDDKIIYSSPFNETLDINVFDMLDYYSRDIYSPSGNRKLYVVIFDVQNACEAIKHFIKSYVMFRTIYYRAMNKYVLVENVFLILTTTELRYLNSLSFSYNLITDIKVPKDAFDEFSHMEVKTSAFDMLKDYILCNNLFFKAEKFKELMKALEPFNIDKFLILCNLIFGFEITETIGNSIGYETHCIKQLIGRNPNLCSSIQDSHMVSQLIELLNLNQNGVIVTDDFTCFTNIKDVNYIVLNNRLGTQVFSALVEVIKYKQKSIIVIDLDNTHFNDVFNLLDFIIFNPENIDESTYFERADIQIFKHYLSPHGLDVDMFAEIQKLVSILLVCSKEQYEKVVPCTFKDKCITIKHIDFSCLVQRADNKFDEAIQYEPYIHVPTSLFHDLVCRKHQFFQSRFLTLSDKLGSVKNFVSELLQVKELINNMESGNVFTENIKKDYTERLEVLTDEKRSFNEMLDKQNEKINSIKCEIEKIQTEMIASIQHNMNETLAKITELPFESQVEQINSWTNDRVDYSDYIELIRDLFDFPSLESLTNRSTDPLHCNLVLSFKQFTLEKPSVAAKIKLEKHGLSRESSEESLIKKLMKENLDVDSSIPIVKYILKWVSSLVSYNWLQDDLQSKYNELTEEEAKLEDSNNRIKEIDTEVEDITTKLGSGRLNEKCPECIADVWKKSENELKGIVSLIEECSQIIAVTTEKLDEASKNMKKYSSLIAAYELGFGSLEYQERRKILENNGCHSFLSPFYLLENIVEMELYFPFSSPANLFSCSEQEKSKFTARMTANTALIYSSMIMTDQLIGQSLSSYSARLFGSYDPPKFDSLKPTPILYDPLDIASQFIIASVKNTQFIFTSNKESRYSYISGITKGKNIIVFLDSNETANEFMKFVNHIRIQVATGKISYDNIITKVSKNFTTTFITKRKDIEIPNAYLVDIDVPDISQTNWFEYMIAMTVNNEIEKSLNRHIKLVLTKGVEILNCIFKLLDYSSSSWETLFKDLNSILTIRILLEHIVADSKELDESNKTIKEIISDGATHPLSICQYKFLYDLCRKLFTNNTHVNVLQCMNSVRDLAISKKFAPMTPSSAISSFSEVILSYINMIPNHKRMSFMVSFENDNLKEVLQSQDLMFEDFPTSSEKVINAIMPQLISCVIQKHITLPRSYFSYSSADSVPLPLDRPVIIELDDLIPTDFYCRVISQHLITKGVMLLTIGSFSSSSLQGSNSIYTIIKGCAEKAARLLIIYDDLLPEFVINSVIVYCHQIDYCSFYIMTRSCCIDKIPLVPNAIRVRISKPSSMFGCTKFLNTIHYFKKMDTKPFRPLLYLILILMHRNDFPVKLLHILPTVSKFESLFAAGQFQNAQQRKSWRNMISTFIRTYTPNQVVADAYSEIFNYFFMDPVPQVPFQTRIDLNNDTIFSNENFPSFAECGMLCNYGESLHDHTRYGWDEVISGKQMLIGEAESAEYIINDAKLVNIRQIDGYLSDDGSDSIVVSIVNSDTTCGNQEGSVSIPVFDGEQIVGSASAFYKGKNQNYSMAAAYILLPKLEDLHRSNENDSDTYQNDACGSQSNNN